MDMGEIFSAIKKKTQFQRRAFNGPREKTRAYEKSSRDRKRDGEKDRKRERGDLPSPFFLLSLDAFIALPENIRDVPGEGPVRDCLHPSRARASWRPFVGRF